MSKLSNSHCHCVIGHCAGCNRAIFVFVSEITRNTIFWHKLHSKAISLFTLITSYLISFRRRNRLLSYTPPRGRNNNNLSSWYTSNTSHYSRDIILWCTCSRDIFLWCTPWGRLWCTTALEWIDILIGLTCTYHLQMSLQVWFYYICIILFILLCRFCIARLSHR